MNKKDRDKLVVKLIRLNEKYGIESGNEDLLIVKSFLLVLGKRGLINGDNLVITGLPLLLPNIPLSIQKCVDNSDDTQLKDLYYGHIKQICDSIKKESLDEIYYVSFNISSDFKAKQIEEVFDILIEVALSVKNDGAARSSIQPKELTGLINYFCDFSNVKDYYNPFAGVGSMALTLPEHIYYRGEELNETIWLLGKLRFLIRNISDNFEYLREDSIKNMAIPDGKKYDFIGINPPLNLRQTLFRKSPFRPGYPVKPENAFSFIIRQCFERLNQNGKMAIVTASGFLFSSARGDKQLKKELTDNGHIEKIIALPGRIFNFTGIAVNIIVINKKADPDRKVEFIDATNKFKKFQKINILDEVGIIGLIEDQKNDLKRQVSIEEISENKYNLSVHRYLFEDLNITSEEVKNLVPLRNLISDLTGNYVLPAEEVKVVRIRDMADSLIAATKSFADVESKKPKYRVKLLENNALMLATLWKTFKPTIYKKEQEDVYYDPGSIFACKVDETIIDPEYLVLELSKDYAQKQLEQKSLGTAVSRISKRDLLNIEVVVPERSVQEKRKFEFKESVILEHQNKLETLKKEYGIDTADENSFLRHRISGTLNNIRGSFNKIKDILENQIVKELPEVYNYKADSRLDSNLGDYLSRLDRDIKSIHRAVQNSGWESRLEEITFETIDFLAFIKGYVEEVGSRPSSNFMISIDIDKEVLRENKIKEIQINGNREFLYQVFDNIIENARRHAFSHKEKQNNRMEVSLFYDLEDHEIQLDFTNTGKPLPEEYTLQQFIRKGSTAGTNGGNGFGGWFMNKVMKLHGGSLNFTDETEGGVIGSDYATTIELTFPIEIITELK